MIFYHASSVDISAPCPVACARHSRAEIEGNPIVGLFCNTSRELSIYGENIYSFSLSPTAKVFEIDSKIYWLMRHHRPYRAGLFDALRACGFSAFRCEHTPDDISGVILDFDMIVGWQKIESGK